VIVPPGVRIRPIALIAALAIMVVTLLYAAVNRNHPVGPKFSLMHQVR